MGIVIYGFAGTGKTTFCKKYKNAIDLEESNFRYKDLLSEDDEKRKGVQKQLNFDFPTNYFNAINQAIKDYDYVFVSYNAIEYCKNNGLPYFLFFPKIEDKKYYFSRYKNRGNSKQFISNMKKKFACYIKKESKDRYAERICFLNNNEFIEDGFKKLGLIKEENCCHLITKQFL